MWLSGSLTAGILVLAVAAGWRAAPAPVNARPPDAGWWNGRLAKDFESHYDAVFPTRTFGINTWAAIGYRLFHEGRPGVVVGRNDWLFSSEEFSNPPGAQAQVEAHLDLIKEVQRRLAHQGSALLVVLVPAKARVVPEMLGARSPDPLHQALYGHALQRLQAAHVAAPDLSAALSACKADGPVFLRTDTHWTPAGARCAAQRIAAESQARGLRTGAPAPYRTSALPVQAHRGDLMTFLPLEPWFASLLPPADRLEPQRTEPLAAPNGLLDEAPPPQVVLVGTSYSANPLWNFTGFLQEGFGEDVVNYAAPAHGPFLPMLEYLNSADFRETKPRLVIWEVPERYLPMSDESDLAHHQGKTP
jgi:alginate O-acetyltransferase complex protein AlgJ